MSWRQHTLLKLLFAFPAFFSVRKCGHLYHLVFIFILMLGLYITASYYSFSSEKLSSFQEGNNETGYTETAIIMNTETTNVMLQKQQHSSHIYERLQLINETVATIQSINIGEISPNCGLPQACDPGTFSVHIYTGKDHRDEPQFCVDGKYVLSKEVNNGGRGVNVAVIDTLTKTVIRVSHFDTYEKDSTPLETLLLTLRPGDIVVLLTFDEPSRKLSRIARLLLYDLGSALIQNLGYRGSWYLITQKGISGFSPYEDLHLVESNGWPKHHDVRFCVPFKIKGNVIHPDPLPSRNPLRNKFCEKHGDFPLFCDADVINDPLSPAPVWKQPSAINKIYNVPILVMSGENIQYLPLTLETLIHQPGIKPTLVVVYHLPRNILVQHLSDLFGYMSEELTQTTNYCERIAEAFEITSLLYPDAKEMIFIGENAILSPDFLYYMGQLLSVMNMDPSILSVSALNENGFKTVSGDPSVAYRVESFSSLAILVRRNFFHRSWCNNESTIDPLYISSEIIGESLIPDVSRVALAASITSSESNQDISSVFLSHDRTVTYEQNIVLKTPERLFWEDYEREIETLLTSSMPLEFDTDSLLQCLKNRDHFQEKFFEDLTLFVSNATNFSNQVLAVYYYQHSVEDMATVQHLSQCFGLFYHPLYPVRGMYKGILRFMMKDNQAILVGSKSPFFRFKPKQIPVLRMDQNLGSIINTLV